MLDVSKRFHAPGTATAALGGQEARGCQPPGAPGQLLLAAADVDSDAFAPLIFVSCFDDEITAQDLSIKFPEIDDRVLTQMIRKHFLKISKIKISN